MLQRFLRVALTPLARLSIRRGLKFQDFLMAGKLAFIDAARLELQLAGSKESKSRLSVMTGLQRKDIRELSEEGTPAADHGSYLMKVIGLWRYNKKFQDPKGNPKQLSIESGEFEALVQSVSKDLSQYTVLFELERLGAITKNEDLLTLRSEVLDISQDKQVGLELLSDDIGHLTNSVSENIFERPAVPNLHIKTQYDNISPEDAEEVRSKILEIGTRFHAELRTVLSQYDKDLNPMLHNKPGGVRVTVGSFSEIEK